MYVDRNACADLGFVTRTDIHRTDANIRITPRPKILGLRKVDFFMFANRIANRAGVVQDWLLSPNIDPEWSSGESVFAWYGWGFTRLEEGFRLSDTLEVPAGKYDTWQVGWFAGTSPRRPVGLRVDAPFQGIYGGTIHSIGGTVSAAPSPNLAVGITVTRNLADLPSGSFTADLATLRLTLALSTRFVTNALVKLTYLFRF